MWRLIADYHTHTRYSHGTGTIGDNVRQAQKRGLEIIGIADHGPASWKHLGVADLDVFNQIIAETRQARREFSGIEVLAGTEANIISYDGELDVPLAMQKKLDQVLAGFHLTIHPRSFGEGVRYLTHWSLGKIHPRIRQKARADNTKAIVEAVYRNQIDIITHPGLKISIDTPELARACVKRGTALEINSKHGVHSLGFIRAAAREGAVFAIGSDAHCPERVGDLESGLRAARLAGLRGDQIINVREE